MARVGHVVHMQRVLWPRISTESPGMQWCTLWRQWSMFRGFYRGKGLRGIRMRRYRALPILYLFLCSNILAAVNAQWQVWGSWSACSASCGQGSQFRARACTGALFGGDEQCSGESSEAGECKAAECPGILFWKVRREGCFTQTCFLKKKKIGSTRSASIWRLLWRNPKGFGGCTSHFLFDLFLHCRFSLSSAQGWKKIYSVTNTIQCHQPWSCSVVHMELSPLQIVS